jgi:hypothetical protein
VYADLVKEGFINNVVYKSHMVLAYLDCDTSYGSIAEIAFASARGIPVEVVVVRQPSKFDPEDPGNVHPHDEDGMFDAYYFVCSFPHVQVTEVQNKKDGYLAVKKILNREFSKRFENSYKFIMHD